MIIHPGNNNKHKTTEEMNNHPHSIRKTQQGLTMIEVLVTTIVLALGILGTSALQLTSIKGTDSAHYRTVATMIANDMAERMRSNSEGVTSGDYETGVIDCGEKPEGYLDCSGNTCLPSQLAIFDTFELSCGFATTNSSSSVVVKNAGVVNSLPDGEMAISCGDTGCTAGIEHTITITWLERADAGTDSATASMLLTIVP